MNLPPNLIILNQQVQGLIASPKISANAISSFAATANAISKGVDVTFSLVDLAGVSAITLRRNYRNDINTATVLQTWTALVSAYTWSDTDSALQSNAQAYYWLTLSPTGTTGTAADIGPQEIFLGSQPAPPLAPAGISASHAAAANGAVLVTVNVNGVPATGSIKIYVTGYQGNANPVAVAQSSSSPVQFSLLATGETVTLQAVSVSAGGVEQPGGPTTTLVLNGTATVPAEPLGVTVAQLVAGYQISFPANLDSVTSYQIWRANRGLPFSSATLIATIMDTNVGTIEYLDAEGTAGDYEYFVVAVNAAGSSLPSAPASVGFISATSVLYVNGVAVAALQPAQVGADQTLAQPIVYTGLSSNLIPNGDFILGNIKGWVTLTGPAAIYTGYPVAPSVIQLSPLSGVVSPSFNVTPGSKYRCSFTGWASPGTQATYLRIFGGSVYAPNIADTLGTSSGFLDFLAGGAISNIYPPPLNTYTYDWTCPEGTHYCSLAMYAATSLGSPATLAFSKISAQDYVAAAEWGADITGSNTAANTNAVGARAAGDVANTVNAGGGIDFNNAGNTNQGALSKLSSVNTTNITAHAISSTITFQQTTQIVAAAGGPTVLAQPTITTASGYVKITVMMQLLANTATSLNGPSVSLMKGSETGTLLIAYDDLFITPNGQACFSLQAIDPSPSASQQYTIFIYTQTLTVYCNAITVKIENMKVA